MGVVYTAFLSVTSKGETPSILLFGTDRPRGIALAIGERHLGLPAWSIMNPRDFALPFDRREEDPLVDTLAIEANT